MLSFLFVCLLENRFRKGVLSPQALPGLCFGTWQVSICAERSSVSFGLPGIWASGLHRALSMLSGAWFFRTCLGRRRLEDKAQDIPNTQDRVAPNIISVPLKYMWTLPRVISLTSLCELDLFLQSHCLNIEDAMWHPQLVACFGLGASFQFEFPN